jgi:hypothetical protein
LIEVCPGAAQSLNGTGPCAEGADLLINGLDSAAMDAPGEEEDEPPAINALFWSVTFVHSEEAYSIPAIIDQPGGQRQFRFTRQRRIRSQSSNMRSAAL